MAVSNKSNKSNKSNLSNKSNKSNKSTLGADLDHAGGASSLTLSAALDQMAVDLAVPFVAGAADGGLMPGHEMRLRKLDPRHLHAILVDDLLTGLTVHGFPICGMPPSRCVVRARKGCAKRTETVHIGWAYTDETLDEHLRAVADAKWIREDRLPEIFEQQTDLLSFLALAFPMGADTHPWLGTLLDAIQDAAERVSARVKFAISSPRPARLSPAIDPVIQTPAHSASPSGHAVESFALAYTLESLAFGGPNKALRIAENRVVAGVHFPGDNAQGEHLAVCIVRHFCFRMGLGATVDAVTGSVTLPPASNLSGIVPRLADTSPHWRDFAAAADDPPGPRPLRVVTRFALAEI